MKIWITFDRVSSLQCGGLERCSIWFQKPQYHLIDRKFDYDSLPFGGGNQKEGLTEIGWRYSETNGKETKSISLGKVFGYDSDISNYVWEELCKFFQSDDLRIWDVKEKELNLNPKDFMLEIDVDFQIKSPKENYKQSNKFAQ